MLFEVQRPIGTELLGARYLEDEMAGQRQEEGSDEAILGQLDGGTEYGAEWEPSEAIEQREPSIDRSGHGDTAEVTAHRHDRVALGSQPGRTDARPGSPDRQQGDRIGSRGRDHGEEVSAHAAQMRAGDRHHRGGRHGGVGRAATSFQHGDAGM